MLFFSIIIGKTISFISRALNRGNGSTWPGEVALKLDPTILSKLGKQFKKGITVIAGTNGKTTTAKMVTTILNGSGTVVHNNSGANLLNGIVSAMILATNANGKINKDYAVLETDENTLPLVLDQITPNTVLCLNLFRDQLDRYGEVDIIADKWHNALEKLPETSTVILNADDPQIAFLARDLKAKIQYFGLDDPSLYLDHTDYATDSTYCFNCGNKLTYEGVYFSHLGKWRCDKCQASRPELNLSSWNYPLRGVYNRYNTLAAVLAVKASTVATDEAIKQELIKFSPAFGRQEEIDINGKKIIILLSKNPTGFNESLRTVIDKPGNKSLLIVLNDRIPDGRDISWIWDVGFEMIGGIGSIGEIREIGVSGDRVYDLALRLKYANTKVKTYESLQEAVDNGVNNIKAEETLYILPTYSAMLDVRKIISGKKIL